MDSDLETRIDDRQGKDLRKGGKDLHKIFDVERPGDETRAEASPPPKDKKSPDADPRRSDDGGEAPERSDGSRTGKTGGLSRGRKILLGSAAAFAIAVVAAGGALYYAHYVAPYETTDDAFVDARSFSIAPKVAGYVVGAPVTDNQHVEAGQTLFDIDRRDYQIALEQAEAQVQSAQAAIQNYDAQIEAQKAQVQGAQSSVEQAEAALKFAQQDADRYSDLAKKGYGTVQNQQSTTSTLQQRQAAADQAKSSLAAATSQIKTLQASRESAVADLARARAQRDQAKLNLDYTHVAAAQSGRLVRLTGARASTRRPARAFRCSCPTRSG
ncbi:HlyD family secretion protein [Chenggangzhangella methanolivorans]|uniref:HlyD family secretion protein n=1 Tax=Chenggangzhangella methanolivorans TaxID=1437009 RepID=UPI003204E2D7